MLFGGDKHTLALLVTLVIIIATLPNGFGADVGTSGQLKIGNNDSAIGSGESITAKMLQIRRLVMSLFSDWKLGESDFEGAVTRTFGFRFRMIRKMILPMAFLGGFMTAIILFIKVTGVINMLLLIKVLLLQKAMVLGKVLWGLFSIFKSKYEGHHESPKYYPYPVYIPHEHHGESSYAGAYSDAHSRGDYNHQPNLFYSQQELNYHQPLFRRPQSYRDVDQPQINASPQYTFGQPQSGSFSGLPLEPPRQVRYTFPYNQLQGHGPENQEAVDNRINTGYSWNSASDSQKVRQNIENPASSYTPQEMTKILSDVLAQVAARPPRSNYQQRTG